jgi:hypothetical protein
MQDTAAMAALFTGNPVKLTPEINSSTGRLNLWRDVDLSLNPNRLSYLYVRQCEVVHILLWRQIVFNKRLRFSKSWPLDPRRLRTTRRIFIDDTSPHNESRLAMGVSTEDRARATNSIYQMT